MHGGDRDEAAVAAALQRAARRTWRAGTGWSAAARAARPSGPRGTPRPARRAGSRRWGRRRRGARSARAPPRRRRGCPRGSVRSAANGSPGPSGVGLEVDREDLKPSSTRRSAIARPMPLRGTGDDDAGRAFSAGHVRSYRPGVTMTLQSPSDAMGTFLPVYGSPVFPSHRSAASRRSRTGRSTPPSRRGAPRSAGWPTYWSAAIDRAPDARRRGARQPALVAADGRPAPAAVGLAPAHRAPQPAHAPARLHARAPGATSCPRSCCRRRRATTPASSTTAPRRARCRRSCAAGLERLYALDWIGVTQETQGRDDRRLPGRGRRRGAEGGRRRPRQPRRRLPGRLAGHDLRGAAPRARQHAHHRRRADRLPRRRRRHPRERRRRSATTTCPSSRAGRRQGNGVLKGEFLLGGFIVDQARERGRQAAAAARRNVRDAGHVERYRAFEDWFKHTQDIAGPVLPVARRAPLPRQRAHRRRP